MPISEFQYQEMLRRAQSRHHAGSGIPIRLPVVGGEWSGVGDYDKESVECEGDLHDQIVDYCKVRGWIVFHARMDCRTTYPLGTPDFIVARDDGRTLYIEAKAKGCKLRPAQKAMLHWLERNKQIVAVVYSLEDFISVSKMP